MWLLTSPFPVARLCSVSRVLRLRFLPVSPVQVSWQSQRLMLYTGPRLSSGLFLSLTLVTSRRKVAIGLCARRMLYKVVVYVRQFQRCLWCTVSRCRNNRARVLTRPQSSWRDARGGSRGWSEGNWEEESLFLAFLLPITSLAPPRRDREKDDWGRVRPELPLVWVLESALLWLLLFL